MVLLVAAGLVLPFATACGPTAAEQMEARRASYDVRLNGFVALEAPLGGPTAAGEPAAAAGTASPVAGEATVGGRATGDTTDPLVVGGNPLVPTRRDVSLDLLVRHDAAEALPGITVDVSQSNEGAAEKAHFRLWLDTSGVARGQEVALRHRLEGVELTPGDRFTVGVVSPVPQEHRSAYREFAGT
jgi:hypothetical protein